MEATFTVNGAEHTVDVEPRMLLVHVIREELGMTGTHVGCDTTQLRRLHRAGGRDPGQVVHGLRRSGRRPRDHDGGGPRRRRAESDAGGVQGGARAPVRVLHAGDDARRHGAAGAEPRSERGRHPVGDLRQHLPLHRLHQHRRTRSARPPPRRPSSPPQHPRNRTHPEGERRTMATQPEEIRGIGHSVRRKEDDRFIRGQGNYIDDIVLPHMLHMAILRSPYAHAKINSVDTTRAAAAPGVVAVVTGELMAQHNLAWMPTLSGDTQAVLATDKVRFQGQEVAAVIAEDPYAAVDALELIDVDYDPLPPVVTPQQAMEAGASVIRDEKEGQTDNHIYHWENGDKDATDAAFAASGDRRLAWTRTIRARIRRPLETCGCLADVNMGTGQVTIYMTSQAPHLIRTVFALVTGLPEENIRIFSPDIGGGFGNKVPVYPGYVVATAASLLLGRPVKWIEDRSENLISTGLRARLPHARRDGAQEGRHDARPPRLAAGRRGRVPRGRPTVEAQGRAVPHRDRLLRPAGRARQRRRRLHEQGARRRRVPLLVPRDGGLVHDRAPRPERGVRARHGSVGAAAEELHQEGAVPLRVRERSRLRLRRLPRRDEPGAREDRVRGAAARAGAGARRGQALRDRPGQLHRGRRRRAAQGLRHPRGEDERRRRAADPPDRQGDPEDQLADPGPGPRDDVRADRRLGARDPARGRQGPARRHRQHALRAGHVRVAVDADGRRGHRDGVAARRREGGQARGAPPGGLRGRHRVHARRRSR